MPGPPRRLIPLKILIRRSQHLLICKLADQRRDPPGRRTAAHSGAATTRRSFGAVNHRADHPVTEPTQPVRQALAKNDGLQRIPAHIVQ